MATHLYIFEVNEVKQNNIKVIIIMRQRCSIQQGENKNSWSEQSPEKSTVSTVPFLGDHPVYIKNKKIIVFLCIHDWITTT